jgi:hypothetical protein
VTGYEVEIQQASGITYATTSHCGQSNQTLANMFCEVPMAVLTNVSGPFDLALGTLVKARVAPVNSIGQGSWSTANTIGILAQTVPL